MWISKRPEHNTDGQENGKFVMKIYHIEMNIFMLAVNCTSDGTEICSQLTVFSMYFHSSCEPLTDEYSAILFSRC